MKKNVDSVRVIAFGAIIILLFGTLCSLFFEDPSIAKSVFPNPNFLIPCINAISLFFAFLLFLFPKLYFMCYVILVPQIIATTMTGHESLGVFLYVLLLVIILFEQTLSFKTKRIIIFFSFFFFGMLLLSVIPYGMIRFCMAIAETIFFITTFFAFHGFLKAKLESLIPEINSKLYFSKEIMLPKVGETVYLSKIGLTERQSELLILFVKKDLSYTQLSKKTNISSSIIKKEMSNCLTIFGCRNIATLRIILSNFQLTY